MKIAIRCAAHAMKDEILDKYFIYCCVESTNAFSSFYIFSLKSMCSGRCEHIVATESFCWKLFMEYYFGQYMKEGYMEFESVG